MQRNKSLEELKQEWLAEESIAHIHGWDFSHINDRYEEEVLGTSWKDLPIDLLYVASGTMDFSYPNQIQDYKKLKGTDDRFVEGENLFLDVFPMKTHSMANWHLALYNLLQHLF